MRGMGFVGGRAGVRACVAVAVLVAGLSVAAPAQAAGPVLQNPSFTDASGSDGSSVVLGFTYQAGTGGASLTDFVFLLGGANANFTVSNVRVTVNGSTSTSDCSPVNSGGNHGDVCSWNVGAIPDGTLVKIQSDVSPAAQAGQSNSYSAGDSAGGSSNGTVTGPTPASGGGGGGGGGGTPPPAARCDWAVGVPTAPRVAMVESTPTYAVRVANAGTAPCPAANLGVTGFQSEEAALDVWNGTAWSNLSVQFPIRALAPGEFVDTTVITRHRAQNFRGIDSLFADTGVLGILASMPPDADGGSDESATGGSDFKVLAVTTGSKPTPNGFTGNGGGQLQRVQVAVGRVGRGARLAAASAKCSWLRNARAQFVKKPARGGVCDQPNWLTATGTKHWRLKLRRKLPPGRYVLYVRPVTPGGAPVSGFSAKAHNRVAFRVH